MIDLLKKNPKARYFPIKLHYIVVCFIAWILCVDKGGSLTLWTRRAGLAAYANRGPETRRADFPAFAMVCQKPEEHLNRRT